jgi:cytochrome c-type biogenesis protein CcmH
MARWIVILTLALLAGWTQAKEAAPAAEDPVLEARMLRIATELRCLVCQNQTIADSHAELAVDLRNQVKEMLKRGDSDQMIIDYMTARYGDFVLYRPPAERHDPGALVRAGAASDRRPIHAVPGVAPTQPVVARPV